MIARFSIELSSHPADDETPRQPEAGVGDHTMRDRRRAPVALELRN
jgi:hypothetical protein